MTYNGSPDWLHDQLSRRDQIAETSNARPRHSPVAALGSIRVSLVDFFQPSVADRAFAAHQPSARVRAIVAGPLESVTFGTGVLIVL